MIEIDVRYDECAPCLQQLFYFVQLLGLESSNILENTLGDNNVKLLVVKLNWRCQKIRFKQIWSGVVYCYIHPVIIYPLVQKTCLMLLGHIRHPEDCTPSRERGGL
jgi:hypothetical protein